VNPKTLDFSAHLEFLVATMRNPPDRTSKSRRRLGSRRRESSISKLLRAETEILRCPFVEHKPRTREVFPIFPQRKRKTRTVWRMAQSDANCSLGSNSLLNKENTGNFRDLGRLRADFGPNKTCLLSVFCWNSLLNRAGNFETRTGNYFSGTGNFIRTTGKPAKPPSGSFAMPSGTSASGCGGVLLELAMVAFLTRRVLRRCGNRRCRPPLQ
jgi:hypothetical protein